MGVFTLLYMSNSNNLKASCIPNGEGRTKFLREKKVRKKTEDKIVIYLSTGGH